MRVGEAATVAVTIDASAAGILLATQSSPPPNTELELGFRIAGPDDAERCVRARVVRVTHGNNLRGEPWPYRLAARFVSPQPQLEEALYAAVEG